MPACAPSAGTPAASPPAAGSDRRGLLAGWAALSVDVETNEVVVP
jgi:hypothetical protein